MDRTQIKLLSSTGMFGDIPLKGRVIETHISWVILSKNLAFKIKKPIRLAFLDFSTLALRKKYCRRELLLNKRWSDIYKEVCGIRNYRGRFIIGGSVGNIVDYAVVMRRVREDLRMDNLLRKNDVSPAQVRRVAICLARIHSKAPRVYRPFSMKYARDLFNDIGHFNEIIRRIGGRSFNDFVGEAITWSNEFLLQHKTRLQQRIERGFQRDLHGDLHSGNIFLEHEPVIFDCIEFNDRYRQIDIL